MTIVNYDWDEIEDNIVEEYDDAGATVAEYTTEPGQFGDVISQRRGAQDAYYHYDGQGSTLVLTDPSGNMVTSAGYAAFGSIAHRTGSDISPFLYIGRSAYYFDSETVSTEVRRRTFCTAIGRWLSKDPAAAAESLFVYANNTPLSAIDPSGLATASIGMVFDKASVPCKHFKINVTIEIKTAPKVGKKLLIFQRVRRTCARIPCSEECHPCAMDESKEEREKNPIEFYEFLGPGPKTVDTHHLKQGGGGPACVDRDSYRRYMEVEIRVFEEKTTVNGETYDLRFAYRPRGLFGNFLATEGGHCFGTPTSFRGYIGPAQPWWDGYVETHAYTYAHTQNCCEKPPKESFGKNDGILYNIDPSKEGPFAAKDPITGR